MSDPDHSALEIQPVAEPICGTIQPPGSKSITNRALLIAALASGESKLTGALFSDDTHVMIDSLQRIGVEIRSDKSAATVDVRGCHGIIPHPHGELFVDNSGTTIRFLTAALGIAGGNYRLDGIERMRQRPIGPLIQALQQLGANVVAESPNGCPPVAISSNRIAGGRASIAGHLSSQYLSGLLMAAPLATNGLTVEIDGELISKPYVSMTTAVMHEFGVDSQCDQELTRFQIPGSQSYQGRSYAIEPDASAASYFWAAAAICGGSSTVTGLNQHSLQGDIGFVRCLEQMGCSVSWNENSIRVDGPASHGIDVDMSNVSDTVQTLAAVALFVDGETTIRNVAHNRVKETDRITNLAIELRKLGATVDDFADGLTIHPGPLQSAELETYNDHRMAMSLALAGLKQPGVIIKNPGCVSKTYPGFFQDLAEFCQVR